MRMPKPSIVVPESFCQLIPLRQNARKVKRPSVASVGSGRSSNQTQQRVSDGTYHSVLKAR